MILLLRFASIYNLLLQFFDGLLTYQVLSLGVPEANPLVNAAIGEWGNLGFTLLEDRRHIRSKAANERV